MRSLRSLSALLLLLLPSLASAQQIYCGGLPGCPTAPNGFPQYIGSALDAILLLFENYVPIFGVLLIMVGGAYILLSAGSSERVEKGKKTIIWSVIGLFVASSAVTLVRLVLRPEAEFIGSIEPLDPIYSLGMGLQSSIFNLLDIALLGVAIFCGMWMVVSMGKEEELKKATMGLFWAAVGAIIINLAEAITLAFLRFT
jgi:hypothetical protein